LTALSMSSLTITALLAVVAIVEAGFMTEEMDPDSRSYHEAITTLVVGASWVTHLALSIYGSARDSTLRGLFSLSKSMPRPLGPGLAAYTRGLSDDARKISWAVWPCATPTARS
jgi:hypothetical protein